ncbi:hypothetical protein EV580_1351 [Mycobacterium sp. BK086]|uniref:hypothetical protein n=1 Tax=Mycobacterium sp. BK086 TaxID=2512165 RepID=UPI0010600587|nr:hypothetical protein [Mycobacterium sp. BK086]TDO18167.1 hypothetical protein EV580_1351 [Mycobacterium sp. BK086]
MKPMSPVKAAEQLLKSLAGEEGNGTDLWTPVQAYRRAYSDAADEGDQLHLDLVQAAAAVLRAVGRLP